MKDSEAVGSSSSILVEVVVLVVVVDEVVGSVGAVVLVVVVVGVVNAAAICFCSFSIINFCAAISSAVWAAAVEENSAIKPKAAENLTVRSTGKNQDWVFAFIDGVPWENAGGAIHPEAPAGSGHSFDLAGASVSLMRTQDSLFCGQACQPPEQTFFARGSVVFKCSTTAMKRGSQRIGSSAGFITAQSISLPNSREIRST